MNGNDTLDRIQREIQENLEREEELRKLYNNNERYIVDKNKNVTNGDETKLVNGHGSPDVKTKMLNGHGKLDVKPKVINGTNSPVSSPKSNGLRLFTQNLSTRGLMQKFLKNKGKVSVSSVKTENSQNGWSEDFFLPAKVTTEMGKPTRNGFVPADQKIKKELEEFTKREHELRNERRKSQPNLMALLDLEEEHEEVQSESSLPKLKTAKSFSNLLNEDEDSYLENNSESGSLKPSRSLAALCDISDEELDTPGTYSLILQFEKMKTPQKRA